MEGIYLLDGTRTGRIKKVPVAQQGVMRQLVEHLMKAEDSLKFSVNRKFRKILTFDSKWYIFFMGHSQSLSLWGFDMIKKQCYN